MFVNAFGSQKTSSENLDFSSASSSLALPDALDKRKLLFKKIAWKGELFSFISKTSKEWQSRLGNFTEVILKLDRILQRTPLTTLEIGMQCSAKIYALFQAILGENEDQERIKKEIVRQSREFKPILLHLANTYLSGHAQLCDDINCLFITSFVRKKAKKIVKTRNKKSKEPINKALKSSNKRKIVTPSESDQKQQKSTDFEPLSKRNNSFVIKDNHKRMRISPSSSSPYSSSKTSTPFRNELPEFQIDPLIIQGFSTSLIGVSDYYLKLSVDQRKTLTVLHSNFVAKLKVHWQQSHIEEQLIRALISSRGKCFIDLSKVTPQGANYQDAVAAILEPFDGLWKNLQQEFIPNVVREAIWLHAFWMSGLVLPLTCRINFTKTKTSFLPDINVNLNKGLSESFLRYTQLCKSFDNAVSAEYVISDYMKAIHRELIFHPLKMWEGDESRLNIMLCSYSVRKIKKMEFLTPKSMNPRFSFAACLYLHDNQIDIVPFRISYDREPFKLLGFVDDNNEGYCSEFLSKFFPSTEFSSSMPKQKIFRIDCEPSKKHEAVELLLPIMRYAFLNPFVLNIFGDLPQDMKIALQKRIYTSLF